MTANPPSEQALPVERDATGVVWLRPEYQGREDAMPLLLPWRWSRRESVAFPLPATQTWRLFAVATDEAEAVIKIERAIMNGETLSLVGLAPDAAAQSLKMCLDVAAKACTPDGPLLMTVEERVDDGTVEGLITYRSVSG